MSRTTEMLHVTHCQNIFTFCAFTFCTFTFCAFTNPVVTSGALTIYHSLLSLTSSDTLVTSLSSLPFTKIHLSELLERSSTMAMINQLHRGPRYHHQPTPYFFVGLPGENPHSVANLTRDFRYLHGLHCIGLMPGPCTYISGLFLLTPPLSSNANSGICVGMGPVTAAVAPMIELDLDRQLQQDVSTLPESRSQCLS